jgi:peptidoglycan/LPS O-acetylase OafA/YrhL
MIAANLDTWYWDFGPAAKTLFSVIYLQFVSEPLEVKKLTPDGLYGWDNNWAWAFWSVGGSLSLLMIVGTLLSRSVDRKIADAEAAEKNSDSESRMDRKFGFFSVENFFIGEGYGFPGVFVESRLGGSILGGNSTLGGVTKGASSRVGD